MTLPFYDREIVSLVILKESFAFGRLIIGDTKVRFVVRSSDSTAENCRSIGEDEFVGGLLSGR